MKIRLAVLVTLFLLLTVVTSAQTRYVFGTHSYTDTNGAVWLPVPSSAMSGVQGTNWRASTCTTSSMGLYSQQYLFMLATAGQSGTITVPVPQGTYTVNMYFYEPCGGTAVGARVFSLSFNGTVIDPTLDIVKEAGGIRIPLTKTGTVTGSSVAVQMKLVSGSNPIFAALEILPAAVMQPPAITTQPAAQTVNRGTAATFSVVATGQQLSYQWSRNGAPVAGATSASYTTPQTTSADSGASFSASVTNPGGAAISQAVSLTVRTSAPLDNSASQFTTTLPGYDALGQCGTTIACTSAVTAATGSASTQLVISIGAAVPPVSITTTSLPGGMVNVHYSAQLAATGGKAPYTWSITAGALPVGLSMSSTGLISGTPTAVSAPSFTVMVQDSSGLAARKSFGKKMTVTGGRKQ